MAYSPRLLGNNPKPPSQIGEKLAKTWEIMGPYVTGPVDAFRHLMESPAASGFEFTEQDAGNALMAGGGPIAAGSVVPKPNNALMMGIKAYHGSPHSFDKFDMSKIGTGEGAQAYGHGLYFAEKEDIARSYRDALSPHMIDGKPVDYNAGSDLASSWLTAFNDRTKAADYLQGQIDNPPKSISNFRTPEEIQAMKEAITLLRSDAPIGKTAPSGHMYEVNIDADPNAFLDWDKPLSEQPEAVRRLAGWTPEAEAEYKKAMSADTDNLLAALEGDGQYTPAKMAAPPGAYQMHKTGEQFYRDFVGKIGGNREKLVEKYGDEAYFRNAGDLANRELGIPGIKYLDAGSRGAGDGTRNYVVFDDKLISIVRKYGIAGASAMLGYNLMDGVSKEQADTLSKADLDYRYSDFISRGGV